MELPFWYKRWPIWKSHSPEVAATQLMGFSNTTNDEDADRRIEKIKTALGLKTDRA
jgi:hypothetical protein